MPRRWWFMVALVMGSAFAPLGLAPPAQAHSGLQDTEPAASAVLEESPPVIRLEFGQQVESRLASVELFDQYATKITLGDPGHPAGDRRVIEASVPPLADGTFVVVWRVISADGHPADGAFTFQLGTSSGTGPVDIGDLLSRVMAGRRADPAVGWLLGVFRWVGRLGAMVLVGGGALVVAARHRPDQRESVRRMLWASWWWVFAGSLGVFALTGPHVTRRSLGSALDMDLWSDVLGTRAGRAIELRWALLLVAGYLISTLARSGARWWRSAAAILSVALLATFPFSGHAGATDGSSWASVGGIGVALGHLVATSIWLGGLVALLVCRDEPIALRYVRWATVAIPVAVLTGLGSTLILVDDLGRLTDTTWGRVLVVKVVVVLVAVVVGGVARWLLLREGAASIRRVVWVEIGLGLVIVSLAAGLLAVSPGGDLAPRPVNATLVADSVVLEITVTPARMGPNEVHLTFVPPGGSLQQLTDVRAALVLPSREGERLEVELAFAGPNHWSGLVRVPYTGDWELTVEAEGPSGQPLRFSTGVTVSS
jgi:copper transport protein